MRRRPLVLSAAALVTTLVFAGLPASGAHGASPTVTTSSDPLALGRALAGDTSWVTGASFLAHAGSTSTALVGGGVTGLPTSGASAALLSTGDASLILEPNTSGSSGTDLGGPGFRGNTDLDVTVLKVDLDVPATANCLVGMDFRFLSEEYPEFVGSVYNDAFIAELDKSTWTTVGSEIDAPNNFAFDPSHNPITINASGLTSMRAEEASGTTFDGATPLLTAATPLSPGAHSLYLSIFDQGDHAYDSAVIVDNLRLGMVGNPATDCRPGATVVDKSAYVALGDSYSSGFGVAPYLPGTHQDAGPNDCQRSTSAYSTIVADNLDLDLDFHACQGAVTKDFTSPRNSTWGERAQLDNLSSTTGLVTASIGGNDAKFADILAECILGAELLPFNTCYNDEKVKKPVREAMARLDGTASLPTDIKPYGELYQAVRSKAGTATLVAVGYPHFYPAAGGDRTFLPGGRCEGVKKADQRWMVEKIDELNRVVERNARRYGVLFANPNPKFDSHELCGSSKEWIFPLLDAGKFHPTKEGQASIAQSVLDTLAADGFQRFTVKQNQKVTYSFTVGSGKQFLSVNTGWPGSDVALALVDPSGRRIDRSTSASDVSRETGPTYEHVDVTRPASGTWTAELTGLEVDAAGEPVTLSTYTSDPVNQNPTAGFGIRVEGEELVLDASRSKDPDGTIKSADWYVSTATQDVVLQGTQVRIPLTSKVERTITLVVTDNRGGTDFTEARVPVVDVIPNSIKNVIDLKSKVPVPVALLSSKTFDATKIDPKSLTLGPGRAPAYAVSVTRLDVNRDGYRDLVVGFPAAKTGLRRGDTQVCLDGRLTDTETFSSCDKIRVG